MESIARRRVYNRLRAVMTHIEYYGCRSQIRLATDAGVSPSAISRLLAGNVNPSFAMVMAVCTALEAHLGRRIDPKELVSMDGTYPTRSVCTLCGCSGCLPPQVYAEDDTVRPEYRHIEQGHWALEPIPHSTGYRVVAQEDV